MPLCTLTPSRHPHTFLRSPSHPSSPSRPPLPGRPCSPPNFPPSHPPRSCTRLATDRPHVIYDPHARRVWPPVAKAPAHDVFSALLPFLTWRMGAVILTSGPDSASTLATGASSEPLTAIARSVSFLGIPTDVALRVVPLQEGGCRVEFQARELSMRSGWGCGCGGRCSSECT